MKYLKPYNIYNESVKDYLKPKSEEELKIAIKNLDSMSADDKIFYILEHNLMFLFSKDEFKKLMSQANPRYQIDHIFDYGLNGDLYSDDEIKDITSKADPDNQISIIYDWGMLEYLFSKDYVKNLVYKKYIDSYDRLDTIYNRYTDELEGIFDDDDIKKIVNQDSDDPERMIRNIEEFNIIDIYSTQEIIDIINRIDDIHDRLLCIFNYDMYDVFDSKNIIKMFKSLDYNEQENLISFDELYDILPKSITKKFDG